MTYLVAAGHLHEGTAALRITSANGSKIRVFVSIGVARAEIGESLESLLRRAGQALYAAKHGGRNRVCVCR